MPTPLVIRSASRVVADAIIPLSAAQLMTRHLTGIRDALPYDAAQILVFDRSTDRHRQMTQIGYPPQVAEVMANEFPSNWPKPVWYPIEPGDDLPPTIGSELDQPDAFRRSPIFRDFLGPAGFRDGLTIELNHRGRYVGLANFSSREDDFYTTELRTRSMAFVSLLGHALNATAQQLEAVPESARAIIVDSVGNASRLAGRAPSPLAALPDFLHAIRPIFDAPQSEVAFLWNIQHDWFRVVARRQPDETGPDRLALVITEQRVERPFDLTPTEIKVLTRLVTSLTNEEIAQSMGIGVRTVHSHVSSILLKLDCERRGQVVASAIRNGLFRPETTPETSLIHLLR